MMLYAVIDTNVLVSALLNMDSNPGRVLLSVLSGKTALFLNEEIMSEYRNVLAREKFHFPADLVEVVLRRLADCSVFVSSSPEDYPEVGDPKDRCFYAVTMSGRESVDVFLVTGNMRHFPVKPFVITPSQFAAMLQSAGGAAGAEAH